MPGYRPVAELRGSRPRYVPLAEASELLGGLLSAGQLRDLVVRGQVPGAIRAGRRYFLLRATLGELITDMSGAPAQDGPPSATRMAPRPPPSTFDAPARWASG